MTVVRAFFAKAEMADADIAGWDGAGWYFWDGASYHWNGPFSTRDEAIDAERAFQP